MPKKLFIYLPALFSGVLIALAFPRFDLPLLAWVAFVPLLISVWEKSRKDAFIEGYVFGMTYFFGTLYWIYHSINYYGGVSFPASIAVVLMLCAYLSLYPAVFTFLFLSLVRKTKLPALLIAPVVWVVLEFLRSYALTGFPWASIGYSQYLLLPVIQIADITGVYGISFLVLAVNGALFDIILLRKRTREMPLFPMSYTIVGFVVLGLVMIVSLAYGVKRTGQQRPGHAVSVALVQGNIEQDQKWDRQYQSRVLQTYYDLSRSAAASGPQLIIWPETSVPFLYGQDAAESANLAEFQKILNTNLLFGSVLVRKQTRDQTLLTNSAVLLDPAGKPVYQYDKIHLVPFGEYIPLRKALFFLDKLVVGIGDYVPGTEYESAETDFGSFATLICYEIIFPGLVRKFYTEGGDFMVTITNDAWFGRTAGPYQHFSMAVLRAVENRKPVLRAANTGISGVIDSSGRIVASTPLFQQAVVTQSIRTDSTLTLYTKYGDLFSYVCMVLLLVLLANINVWR